MRGRLWLNLALALVVAALAAVAWFQPGKTPPPPQVKLTKLDPQTVKRIDFHPPRGAAFALVRDGKDWFIDSPRLRAQPFRVETLLELPGAASAAQFTLADNKDNGFGVDPPQARLRFDDTEIAFGLTNPVGLRRYVRVGDAVHLIDDRFYHHAASTWVAWVDRRVLPEGVTLTALDLPGLRLRREGTAWKISPEQPKASADAITMLIEEWQRAYAMDVEESTAVPADARALRLEWQGGALELAVAQDGDEWLLYRRDAPVRYRFSANQGKRLLEIEQTAPGAAQPTGATEPAASDEPDGEAAESSAPPASPPAAAP
ncbi:DUF4340 domain-containing protein [Immundisolibacter cernigliae]|uniref:DUF4340 domain-containing protein n=1 Tax=Immundisolibacter cernigliae TaxID=1810504 RepID=A0A1B1YUU2_9GAMM|nr:DUF4340 domain-containing protein [Immundisolibacter cernigliae]ANX04496.1 hypothetical protein PG2T_10105 [Immundisolibacter cernigliae]